MFLENAGGDCSVSAQELSRYVSLCSQQLQVALDDSRVEMDALTVAALTPGESAAVELVTRLQSVDRLMQRLSNVQSNLEQLAEFSLTKDAENSRDSWEALLAQTRDTFTMEQERNLFDELLGVSAPDLNNADEALTLFTSESSRN